MENYILTGSGIVLILGFLSMYHYPDKKLAKVLRIVCMAPATFAVFQILVNKF